MRGIQRRWVRWCLRVTGLCAGNSPDTGEFPAQMASKAENTHKLYKTPIETQIRLYLCIMYIKNVHKCKFLVCLFKPFVACKNSTMGRMNQVAIFDFNNLTEFCPADIEIIFNVFWYTFKARVFLLPKAHWLHKLWALLLTSWRRPIHCVYSRGRRKCTYNAIVSTEYDSE